MRNVAPNGARLPRRVAPPQERDCVKVGYHRNYIGGLPDLSILFFISLIMEDPQNVVFIFPKRNAETPRVRAPWTVRRGLC